MNDIIENIFSSDNSDFKINRFQQLKQYIIYDKKKLYDEICNEEAEQIYYVLTNELMIESNILYRNNESQTFDIYAVTKKFHRLYIAHVLFPLVYDMEDDKFVDNYSIEFFKEDDLCKNKRSEYVNNVNKLDSALKQITDL